MINFIGTSNSSNSIGSNTPRHYLACSYFVSQYQTIRSFAEELSIKFGKSLEEIRLWMRYSEVSDSYYSLRYQLVDLLLNFTYMDVIDDEKRYELEHDEC